MPLHISCSLHGIVIFVVLPCLHNSVKDWWMMPFWFRKFLVVSSWLLLYHLFMFWISGWNYFDAVQLLYNTMWCCQHMYPSCVSWAIGLELSSTISSVEQCSSAQSILIRIPTKGSGPLQEKDIFLEMPHSNIFCSHIANYNFHVTSDMICNLCFLFNVTFVVQGLKLHRYCLKRYYFSL